MIGDWLTEINVTSPTGIREVKRFGGADIAALVWDAVEADAAKPLEGASRRPGARDAHPPFTYCS